MVGAFEELHRDRVSGSLAMFDRMIFKGHLDNADLGRVLVEARLELPAGMASKCLVAR